VLLVSGNGLSGFFTNLFQAPRFLTPLARDGSASGHLPQFVQVFDSDLDTVQFIVWTVVRLAVARRRRPAASSDSQKSFGETRRFRRAIALRSSSGGRRASSHRAGCWSLRLSEPLMRLDVLG
jgi:hypothetical protein